jgi:methyl-accepting chemotaxis protein
MKILSPHDREISELVKKYPSIEKYFADLEEKLLDLKLLLKELFLALSADDVKEVAEKEAEIAKIPVV